MIGFGQWYDDLNLDPEPVLGHNLDLGGEGIRYLLDDKENQL